MLNDDGDDGANSDAVHGGRDGARRSPQPPRLTNLTRERQVDSIYVINGFYMNMRSKFTAPGTSIYYYEAGKYCRSLKQTFAVIF